jgi:eukaryotic-like serine/threonine-protein kinase
MAIVHLGRLRGDGGFARAVAIKRLHRQYVGDPELNACLLDEARLASRLKHPNVVAPQDVLTCNGEIFVVMEYLHGLTLAALIREARARGESIPIPVVARVVSDVLAGLHAAHEATDGHGRELAIVHRDVSPQNVMVGVDGLTRVLDFGIAQAAFRSQTTRDGQLRAKLAYAAPEHVLDLPVDRRADVYASAIVCWELLTLERLHSAGNESALLVRVLESKAAPPSKFRPEVPPALDALLLSALSKRPGERPSSAEEFALQLERWVPPASHRDVARWVASLGAGPLKGLTARLAELEGAITEGDTPLALVASTETRTSEVPLRLVETKADSWPGPPRKKGVAWTRATRAVIVSLVVAAGLTPVLLRRPRLLAPSSAEAMTPRPIAAEMLAERATAVESTVSSADEALAPAPEAPPPMAKSEPAAREVSKRPPPAGRPTPRVRPRPTSDDCSDLTELDAQGIRRVKRQCLR